MVTVSFIRDIDYAASASAYLTALILPAAAVACIPYPAAVDRLNTQIKMGAAPAKVINRTVFCNIYDRILHAPTAAAR